MSENLTLPLAGILHNLNNYLQAIIGNATLGMNSPLGCVTKNRFRTIQYAAERCSEAIKRLMAMVMSAHRESSPIEISAVVSETIEVFKPVAANIQHIVYSCGDVPNVYGNESDISQILLNLMYNSRDAIQNNGELVVSVYRGERVENLRNGMDNPEDFVCISIRDNGPGIPESVQKKLFTEVKSPKRNHQITGSVLSYPNTWQKDTAAGSNAFIRIKTERNLLFISDYVMKRH